MARHYVAGAFNAAPFASTAPSIPPFGCSGAPGPPGRGAAIAEISAPPAHTHPPTINAFLARGRWCVERARCAGSHVPRASELHLCTYPAFPPLVHSSRRRSTWTCVRERAPRAPPRLRSLDAAAAAAGSSRCAGHFPARSSPPPRPPPPSTRTRPPARLLARLTPEPHPSDAPPTRAGDVPRPEPGVQPRGAQVVVPLRRAALGQRQAL